MANKRKLNVMGDNGDHHTERPVVYFAGKVYKNGQTGEKLALQVSEMPPLTGPAIKEVSLNGKYDLAGYVTYCCDHGCAHGHNCAGMCGLDCADYTHEHIAKWNRDTVIQRCMTQIQSCNVFILRLGDGEKSGLSCYGSLCEAGYAFAMNKLIIVTFEGVIEFDKYDDAWFAIRMARESFDKARRDSKEFLRAVFADIPLLVNKYGNNGMHSYPLILDAHSYGGHP